jgi:hypothetical protein
MAIATAPNPALKRIVEALGLDRCVSLSLSASVASVVTITAEQYVTESQLDALATELERQDYVLVPKDEIARLRLTDAEREAIKAGIACCDDITYGSEADPEAAATLRALLERMK